MSESPTLAVCCKSSLISTLYEEKKAGKGEERGKGTKGGDRVRTEGQRTTPTGPSPFSNGNLDSCSNATMIAGNENARVLPDPVNAMPIISLPENLDAHCACMYVSHDIVHTEKQV